MRKLIIAILAVPVLAVIYAATAVRRPGIMRTTAALGLGAAIGLGVVAFVRPTLTTATPPTDIVPLTAAAFRTSVGTGVELQAGATIGFSTPMERASVEASLDIEPPIAVELLWNDDDTAVDHRAGRPLGRGHLPHDHRPGGRTGRHRPPTHETCAGGLPDARADDRGPRRDGQARQARRARHGVLDRIRSRGGSHERGTGRAPRARGQGSRHGRVGRRRAAALRLHAAQGPQAEYPLHAHRRRRSRPRRRPRAAHRHGGQDRRGPRRRPVPAQGADTGRGPHRGHLGAVQPIDGPCLDEAGLQGARGRQGDQGQDHVRRSRHGPDLRSGPQLRVRHAGRRERVPFRAQRRRGRPRAPPSGSPSGPS